jgi:hypothetical protein
MEPFPRTDHDLSSASPSSETPTNTAHPAYHDSHPLENRIVALIRENVAHVTRSPSQLHGVALEIVEHPQPQPPQPPRDTRRRVASVPLYKMAETMSPIGIANVRIADSTNCSV